MKDFSQYKDSYRYINLTRDDAGVLVMRLHDNGREMRWGFPQHEEVADCLLQISRDRKNKVVILTGTGNVFINEFDTEAGGDENFKPTFADFTSYHLSVGIRLLQNHLDIEVPMIGVVNGPAGIHAELAVMCDIVLCADDAYVADSPHFVNNLVPGDGVHVIWPELLGLNRGRYFLLMGEKIYADEARRLGVVSEVMPRAQLLDRAKAIAAKLADRDDILLRHTRAVMVQKLRKQVMDLLPLGLQAMWGCGVASAQQAFEENLQKGSPED